MFERAAQPHSSWRDRHGQGLLCGRSVHRPPGWQRGTKHLGLSRRSIAALLGEAPWTGRSITRCDGWPGAMSPSIARRSRLIAASDTRRRRRARRPLNDPRSRSLTAHPFRWPSPCHRRRPIGLMLTALLQSIKGFPISLYEKPPRVHAHRMVQSRLISWRIQSRVSADYIDGDTVATVFDPEELHEGLALRRSASGELMADLRGWTRGSLRSTPSSAPSAI